MRGGEQLDRAEALCPRDRSAFASEHLPHGGRRLEFFLSYLDYAGAKLHRRQQPAAFHHRPQLNTINGNYTYLVTYARVGERRAVPPNCWDRKTSSTVGPCSPTCRFRPRRRRGEFPAYDTVRIYRNLASYFSRYYLVGEVCAGRSLHR